MSDSSLKHQLKVITIPVFIEIALVMLLGAVDTIMLSHYSDNSVAAVGLDNQLISLVFLVYQFFSMGAAILCAQYIGAGLRKRLVQVVGMALVVNLMLGLTVSCLLFFFAENLLHMMGLRPRREHPWSHPASSLALREVAQQRVCQRKKVSTRSQERSANQRFISLRRVLVPPSGRQPGGLTCRYAPSYHSPYARLDRNCSAGNRDNRR